MNPTTIPAGTPNTWKGWKLVAMAGAPAGSQGQEPWGMKNNGFAARNEQF